MMEGIKMMGSGLMCLTRSELFVGAGVGDAAPYDCEYGPFDTMTFPGLGK